MAGFVEGLLDVLKETLSHQEQIRDCLVQYKRALVLGDMQDVDTFVEEIDRLCTVVSGLEGARRAVMTDIALFTSEPLESLTATRILQLSTFASVREEMRTTVINLRNIVEDIARLRDDVVSLASNALSYSVKFVDLLRKGGTGYNARGLFVPQGARFVSIRT